MLDDQNIRKIYDWFDEPNMTFEDFRKEMRELTDQKLIQRDLADIELQKARTRTSKIRIDATMERN